MHTHTHTPRKLHISEEVGYSWEPVFFSRLCAHLGAIHTLSIYMLYMLSCRTSLTGRVEQWMTIDSWGVPLALW